FLLARFVSRSWSWAAMAASAIVLLGLREPLAGGVLAALALWIALLTMLRRATGRPPLAPSVGGSLARGTGVFSLAFLAIMAWSAWTAEEAGRADFNLPEYTVVGSGGPNIYLILLDGYPRADTLEQTFGIDNASFTDGLAA